VLREVQAAFSDAMVRGGTDAETHVRSGVLSARERLAIYRHNVLSNLRGALKDIFPVTRNIVGEAFFIHAADQFIAATPSRSGDLNRFGGGWADFLAAYIHAADLPYLADVARLEWAWHESFHAADAAALDLKRLGAVPAEAHGSLRFRLQPAVRLLASPYPLLRIWQVNQPGYADSLEIDWTAKGDSLLIYRESAEVVIRVMSPGAFRLLSALSCGAALEPAAEAAFGAEAHFDLQGFLIESAQSGIIVDFEVDGAGTG
jgi:hypothetical protein